MQEKGHSADYFGDTRDFWWNRDFLELMSRRWGLNEARSILDVGCGIGHWGRCLAPFLNPNGTMVGVDREPRWIDEAMNRLPSEYHGRFSYQVGDAERLPFPDAQFDLVTCQTLLIHVKDPIGVLREMVRVLKPGGLIVVAEPNNVVIDLCDLDLAEPISKLVRPIEFQMICERGKANLGEGFNSSGPMVAGWLSALNIEGIRVYLSDRATVLLAPYATTEQRAIVEEGSEWVKRDFWIWNREDTLRYFLAGGGEAAKFDGYWVEAMQDGRELVYAYERKAINMASASLMYLNSGRKAK